MTEQEQQVWIDAFTRVISMTLAEREEFALASVRAFRAASATLATEAKVAEEARRGEAPFKVGQRVRDSRGHGPHEGTVREVFYADNAWRINVEFHPGQIINGLLAEGWGRS